MWEERLQECWHREKSGNAVDQLAAELSANSATCSRIRMRLSVKRERLSLDYDGSRAVHPLLNIQSCGACDYCHADLTAIGHPEVLAHIYAVVSRSKVGSRS